MYRVSKKIKTEKTKVSFIAVIIAATMLFTGLTLTGCSTQGGENPPAGIEQTDQNQPAKPQQGSGIVETTLDLVEQGKTLNIDFSLKNSSDKELKLLFGSGHQYDIVVTDVEGREVYNWAADRSFTMAIINKDLAPGQELSYSEEWDYTDNEGKPLPAGKYLVKVTIVTIVENEDLKEKVKAEDFVAVKEIAIS